MTTRVGVVDDEGAYARAVVDMLSAAPDMEVVGVGANGVEAIALARDARPDVLLLDLVMPVMGGLEALRRIKAERPGLEVLVLTVQADDASLFEALKAGAKGYLLKNALLDEVPAAVRDVACGRGVIPASLAGRVLAEFARLSAQPEALQRLFRLLSRQETEVLRMIGRNKTNTQIAALLCVELTTIKKQVTSILKKLEVNTRAEAALIAHRSGLLDETAAQAPPPRASSPVR